MSRSLLQNNLRFGMGLLAGVGLGYLAVEQSKMLSLLLQADPIHSMTHSQNTAPRGRSFLTEEESPIYFRSHSVEDGIERVSYYPKKRRHDTPLLFAHGMWHGAWCWETWQAQFAAWGWESHAYSLPGHANSPVQRRLAYCTLDYYLSFLADEVHRLPIRPVLLGHSMGGALAQWYLKYGGDNLPAVALVAPWVHDSVLADSLPMYWKRDPTGPLRILRSWDAWPMVETPQLAAQALISPRAIISPAALHRMLGRESAVVLLQHNPPYWRPPLSVRTPMLVLAGEQDALVSVPGLRRTAHHYGADFVVIEQAGHNLMMEHNQHKSAEVIQHWLAGLNLS